MKNIEKYLIIILSFIAVGAICAAVYFGLNSKQTKEKDKVNEIDKNEENQNDNYDNNEKYEDHKLDDTYKNLTDNLISSDKLLFPDSCSDKYSYGIEFENKFYTTGIKLNQFSKKDLINAAFYEIDNIPVCSEEKARISLEEINIALKKKFNDSSLEITLNDLKEYKEGDLIFEFEGNVIYVSSSNCDGCGVGPQPFYKNNIEKYELMDNKVYITYYAAYFNSYYTNDEKYKYDVYKPTDIEYIDNGDFIEPKFKNKIEELENSEDITWSKYTLYKATYELIDNELYFRSNEIIKK